jgi:hypothetical protein
LRSSHPEVIAHTNATNAENKRSFSASTKRDDTLAMSRKKQRNVGRFEAMKYFEQEEKMDKFTWSVLIFDNLKGGRGEECNSAALSHHLDNNSRWQEKRTNRF